MIRPLTVGPLSSRGRKQSLCSIYIWKFWSHCNANGVWQFIWVLDEWWLWMLFWWLTGLFVLKQLLPAAQSPLLCMLPHSLVIWDWGKKGENGASCNRPNWFSFEFVIKAYIQHCLIFGEGLFKGVSMHDHRPLEWVTDRWRASWGAGLRLHERMCGADCVTQKRTVPL